MIITIGGLAGTGTTTAAKLLSEKLDIPYVSTGQIFRQMAKERGMSLLEFSELAEKDTTIDIELDKRQAELAKSSSDLIIEGRLSAYFIDADLKVWLNAPLDICAERIADRESEDIDLAKRKMIIREESEASRYKEIHNIDINNMEIYDLIINSGTFKPEPIINIILTTLKVI